MKQFECIYVIVHHGLGSKILKFARNNGIFGGTIFFGTGTVKNFWLDLFELSQSEKEIVIMVAERGYAFRFMKLLGDELEMNKKNHGISFSIPVKGFTGGKHQKDIEVGEEVESMYNAITVVVNKGQAERAMEIAQDAGAKGGTIINARGAGRNESSKIFLMDVEPEKEVLLMIVEKEKTEAVASVINRELKLDEHGNGIMMVQDVTKAYGLYK